MNDAEVASRLRLPTLADVVKFGNRELAPAWVGGGAGIESQSAAALSAWPTGIADTDVVLVPIETNGGSPGTISTAGWAEIDGSPLDATSSDLAIWWHRYVAASSTLPTINDSGDHQVAYSLAFRGCGTDGRSPFEAIGTGTAASSTTVVFPSVTTISWNCLIVHIVGIGRDANAGGGAAQWAMQNVASFATNPNAPGGICSGIFDRTSVVGAGGGFIAFQWVKHEPGETGETTVTIATSFEQSLYTIALR